MDFGRSADEQAFADEVRAFLRAHPPATFPADGTDAGYGSGAHSRAFLGALGERGFVAGAIVHAPQFEAQSARSQL